MTRSTSNVIVGLLVLLLLGLLAWTFLTTPDQRSTGQKIGDAFDALPQGVDKASRQLEDRTPGEKLGDSIKDAGDSVKEQTNQ